MRALRTLGVPYTDADLEGAAGQLEGKTDLDAIVAYMLSLGKAVDRGGKGGAEIDLEERNPLATDTAAIAKGRQLFEAQACGACHGDEAHGQGVAPSLIDDEFLGQKGDLPDAAYFGMIKGGSDVKQQLGRPGSPTAACRRTAASCRTRTSGRSSRGSAPRRATRLRGAGRGSRGAREPVGRRAMAEQQLDPQLDDLRQFDSPKETENKLPVGWLILFFGLIAWEPWYLWTFTPGLGGWSQAQDLEAAARRWA